ncbi:MAG: hypothetical protein HQ582_34105, partial [Planctomycetes bacterium]|nr:hypothetical protein [Planctomycetota bacterium]
MIQTLVYKDQGRRFRSAQDVIRHLRSGRVADLPPEPPDPEAEAAAAEAARKKRTLRIGAISAMVVSALLCLWMLLPNRPGPAVSREPEPARGVVRSVYLGERTLVIERDGDGRPQ